MQRPLDKWSGNDVIAALERENVKPPNKLGVFHFVEHLGSGWGVCQMRRLRRVIALLGLIILASAARAEDEPGSRVPDLTGTWVAVSLASISWHGHVVDLETHQRKVEITEQTGPVFKGEVTWTRAGHLPQLHDGERLTNTGTETVLGVVHWDNATITLVDSDPTMRFWRLVNENTIEAVQAEPGQHAIVGRTIYVRQKAKP